MRHWGALSLAVIAVMVLVLAPLQARADVAYILRRPAGDREVSIVFSYDHEAEREILDSLKIEGHILLWQIQCADKYVFYKPFHFSQGQMTIRPVLCLVKKYGCQTDDDHTGYVFQGYLYLDPAFDLHGPINITLADKVVPANFR